MKLLTITLTMQLVLFCLIINPQHQDFKNMQSLKKIGSEKGIVNNDCGYHKSVSSKDNRNLSRKGDVCTNDKGYTIQTSFIEELIVRDKNGQRVVYEERMNQTFFIIECDDPINTFIRLKNDKCKKKPTVKICKPQKRKCTRMFTFEYGEEISIDSCFIKYPNAIVPLPDESLLDWFKSVFKEVRTGQVACGRKGALMGEDSLGVEGSRLYFKEVDNSYYLDWMDFDLNFTTWSNSVIESIFIIEHQGDEDLIFCAGEVNEIEGMYDLSNKLIPSIDMVLKQVGENENSIYYRLKEGVLTTMSLKEMERGRWYELSLKLKDDSTFYAFNFQFLSQEDVDFLKSMGRDE